LNEANWTVTA